MPAAFAAWGNAQIAAMAKQTWYASFRFIIPSKSQTPVSHDAIAWRFACRPAPTLRRMLADCGRCTLFFLVCSSPLAIEFHAAHECPRSCAHIGLSLTESRLAQQLKAAELPDRAISRLFEYSPDAARYPAALPMPAARFIPDSANTRPFRQAVSSHGRPLSDIGVVDPIVFLRVAEGQ